MEESRVIKQSIPVLDIHIGTIIGKGGCNIRKLSDKTNVKISISEKSNFSYGHNWKHISVEGTPKEVDNAKKMITLITLKYKDHKVDKKEEWKPIDNFSPIRINVTKSIRDILCNVPNETDEWKEKIPLISMKLEETLYSKATTLEEYQNIDTLQNRIDQLIAIDI